MELPATEPWWVDLSDSELVQRLTNRGMVPADAASWIHYRATEGGAEQISRILGEDA